jgi:hypothetical protein
VSILVLTVDGKGVVMRPEDLREAAEQAAFAALGHTPAGPRP